MSHERGRRDSGPAPHRLEGVAAVFWVSGSGGTECWELLMGLERRSEDRRDSTLGCEPLRATPGTASWPVTRGVGQRETFCETFCSSLQLQF